MTESLLRRSSSSQAQQLMPVSSEQHFGKWFRQNICHHCLRRPEVDDDLPLRHALSNEVVPDINVLRSFVINVVLHQTDRAFVVLVQGHGSVVIPISELPQKPLHPYRLLCGLGQRTVFRLSG